MLLLLPFVATELIADLSVNLITSFLDIKLLVTKFKNIKNMREASLKIKAHREGSFNLFCVCF
jgi:hypothetical protein